MRRRTGGCGWSAASRSPATKSTTRSAKSSSRNSKKKSTTSTRCCRRGAPRPTTWKRCVRSGACSTRSRAAAAWSAPRPWASSAGRSRPCSTACSMARVRPSPAVIAMVDQAFYTLAAIAGRPARRDRHHRRPRRHAGACRSHRRRRGRVLHRAGRCADRAGRACRRWSRRRLPTRRSIRQALSMPSRCRTPLPPSIDPVLLEILDTEVGGHLVTVERWVANAGSAPARSDDKLLRAIHTMNGAFAMTEVPSITDAMTPAEAYVKRLLVAHEVASPKASRPSRNSLRPHARRSSPCIRHRHACRATSSLPPALPPCATACRNRALRKPPADRRRPSSRWDASRSAG